MWQVVLEPTLTGWSAKVEQSVDKLVSHLSFQDLADCNNILHQIAQLEAHRDLSQTIVHVDMDAFYASVELLDNPDLASKPFAVSQSFNVSHVISHVDGQVGQGVLTTASYEARKFGVRSGMPSMMIVSSPVPHLMSWVAFIARKLCPELVVISNHFHRYSEMSEKVMAIFRRYDPNMAAAGCDEGYIK